MTNPDRNLWHKSSFSGTTNCVEVAWQKSSFSSNASNCVEVAFPQPQAVAVRDSKNATGPILSLPVGTWRAFSDLLRDDRVGQ